MNDEYAVYVATVDGKPIFFHKSAHPGFRSEVAHTAILAEALGVAKVDACPNSTTIHLASPARIESTRDLHCLVSPTLSRYACKPEALGDSGHSMRCAAIGAAVQAPQFGFDEDTLYAYLGAVPGVLEAVGYDFSALEQAWFEQTREVQNALRPHSYELTNYGHVHFVAPDDVSAEVLQEHAERAAALVDALWVTMPWHETYGDLVFSEDRT